MCSSLTSADIEPDIRHPQASPPHSFLSQSSAWSAMVASPKRSSFCDPQKLTEHMDAHPLEIRYACAMCRQSFSEPQDLKLHMKAYEGWTHYGCTECPAIFFTLRQLDTHMWTHTGDKPFSCPICKNTFATSLYRDTHAQTHNKKPIMVENKEKHQFRFIYSSEKLQSPILEPFWDFIR